MIEEQPREIDGQIIPVDTGGPNPNNEEFDNLYLDMNGIVHPCSHPEDRPPPKDEEEMMLEIFKYTERVVNMVRPRKLLLIAVGMISLRNLAWKLIFLSLSFAKKIINRWSCTACKNESTTI